MINCEKGVPFDPGIGELTELFVEKAYGVECELNKIKSFHAKKTIYQNSEKSLINTFTTNILFYKGCLIWAFYIANSFKENKKEILNNIFYGRKMKEDDFLCDIDWLLSYFEKFERNAKYYYNRSANIDMDLKKIVEAYKKFIVINENFTNTKMADEIKLPEEIIDYSKDFGDKAFSVLNEAIEQKDLTKLAEFNILK